MQINIILEGDCLTKLKELPDESIDCVMTSPPYWALRDYGVEGQLGLESTFEEYITKLCDIFDEIKRVLKKEGTCWVNLGDSYSGNMGKRSGWTDNKLGFSKEEGIEAGVALVNKQFSYSLPDKSLCMIPFRFAIEMVNRGWILRNDIVWYKRNSMPSSVKDRFANKWEHVFLFSKNKKYYFDLDAVRKPHKSSSIDRINAGFSKAVHFNYRVREAVKGRLTAKYGEMYKATPEEIENYGSPRAREWRTYNNKFPNHQFRDKKAQRDAGVPHDSANCHPLGGNPGDFWDITTQPHPFAHFACYPERLCEIPIKAGSPKGGIILDPFFGSGTTGLVALKLGRQFIGIELNKSYIDIAKKRLEPYLQQQKLFPIQMKGGIET